MSWTRESVMGSHVPVRQLSWLTFKILILQSCRRGFGALPKSAITATAPQGRRRPYHVQDLLMPLRCCLNDFPPSLHEARLADTILLVGRAEYRAPQKSPRHSLQ